MEVGVWTASRQSMNLKSSECSDESYYSTEKASYYLDYAKSNIITNNIFNNIATAVRIEDDLTEVAKNIFNGNLYAPKYDLAIMKPSFQNFTMISDGKVWGAPVFAGSSQRWSSYPNGGWPVQSPSVHDNSFLSIYNGSTSPEQGVYVEAYGTKHAVISNNLQGCKSNGYVIASGASLVDYKEEFVAKLADCQGNKRTCVNGALSNYSADYKYGRCVEK